MSFSVVKGDLMKFKGDAIVQQSNCLTTRTHGLSATIKKEFGVDPYSIRTSKVNNVAIKEDRDLPGSIQIFETGISPKYVVCLFGQYQPGTPNKYPKYKKASDEDGVVENYINREGWFKQGLDETKKWIVEKKIKSIAFPFKIGCGLARGNWDHYYAMIVNFQKEIKIDVSIIQL
jgi:O-acetyl-ADP-ribose deacetylase (regulator of RNase III)